MQALEYACQPVFSVLFKLGQGTMQSHDEVLDRLTRRLDKMDKSAKRLGCNPKDVELARYAVVALADEMVPVRCPELADRWRNALQRRIFGENIAGEGFYQRLENILQSPDTQAAARIYALCIALGFRGAYVGPAQSKLPALQRRIRRYLNIPSAPLPLSRNVRASREPKPRPSKAPYLIWGSTLFLCAAIASLAMTRHDLRKQTEYIFKTAKHAIGRSSL